MGPERKFILLGEDDMDDQELLQEVFSEIDDTVPLLFVNNGSDLLSLLASQQENGLPCLIVIDYNMPGMNGAELLREIKEIPRYDKIPRIIWSTSRSEIFRKTCFELGATDYLIKPSTVKELTEIATHMLSFCKD